MKKDLKEFRKNCEGVRGNVQDSELIDFYFEHMVKENYSTFLQVTFCVRTNI